MLTVEIKVNGSLIGAADVINRGLEDGGMTRYEFRCVSFPIEVDERPIVKTGHFSHRRGDGAQVLVRKLYEVVAP